MSVSKISFKSNEGYYNYARGMNYQAPQEQPQRPLSKTEQKIYAGVGLVTIALGILGFCNKKVGTFLKKLLGTVQKELERLEVHQPHTPRPARVSSATNGFVHAEEVDPRFLPRNSKLRHMKPEIVDVEFVEV